MDVSSQTARRICGAAQSVVPRWDAEEEEKEGGHTGDAYGVEAPGATASL